MSVKYLNIKKSWQKNKTFIVDPVSRPKLPTPKIPLRFFSKVNKINLFRNQVYYFE